ncbi:response regulator [Novosphingobium beihaiensis]|uniref:Response regulator n=1 Tax=Novosphingobium beihaiensis TaxID=2930389 RepID=A0ABT0BT21_9SPHN|nr:response regulator [Novosphingobium beihaiensis]MCJ2188123.1 response regulator [Novosphingobium beihaiensis]
MTISILYIDDEPDLREIASMALELDPDIMVRTCASGPEALDLLSTMTPDLILLDMMMPVMDGPMTFAAIRERFGKSIPVVFITARTSPADVEKLVASGAHGVIPKPFDPMKLTAQVRSFVSHA